MSQADVVRRVVQDLFYRRQREINDELMGSILAGPLTTFTTGASTASTPTMDALIALSKKLKPVQSRFVLRTSRFLSSRKQVRFPKTRKKRIRRKWAKRPENYADVPDPRFYQINDSIIAHPKTMATLYAALGVPPHDGEVVLDLLPSQSELLRDIFNGHGDGQHPPSRSTQAGRTTQYPLCLHP